MIYSILTKIIFRGTFKDKEHKREIYEVQTPR